ncbi:hypothetical protein L873DRAFT_1774805, partial [Choiromyces venosus 120613-1]
FIGHKSNLKVGLSPVKAYYTVYILLSNIHTYYWRSATGVKFDCNPLIVHKYLHFCFITFNIKYKISKFLLYFILI